MRELRRAGLAAAAALTLGLAACGDDAPAEVEPPTEDAATEDDDVEDEADADAEVDLDDAEADDDGGEPAPDTSGEPLATADASWGGPGGGEARLDVLEVTRRGEDLMEVRFRLTAVTGIMPFNRMQADGDPSRPATVSGITVEDVDAGERLLVLRDSSGACVCSQDLDQSIPEGGSRDYFARFPAPVSDQVDVAIPTFGTFNDLPVS